MNIAPETSAKTNLETTMSTTTATTTTTDVDGAPDVLHVVLTRPLARRLRAKKQLENNLHVEWKDDVIDNEDMNKKKSKSTCYHFSPITRPYSSPFNLTYFLRVLILCLPTAHWVFLFCRMLCV